MTLVNEMTQSKRLPLHDLHLKLGAKIGAFGEWEVPLYYSTVIEEHNAVRHGVGIFDISHMGEIFVEGPKARHFLNYLVTNQIEKLKPGRALYSPVCNKQGGIVDDVIVYELDSEHYLVIVNASNIDKDYQWFSSHSIAGARITNRSDEYGLLAVQGPDSVAVICKIFSEEIEKLSYYSIMQTSSPWKNTFLARTGYTGELGFEILLPNEVLRDAYAVLMDAGKEFGIKPVGFGARDTLRLEVAMLLYGHDMTDETTPLEAGLERTVAFEKEFIGKEALRAQQQRGVSRKLIGFEMVGHGLARQGYPVYQKEHSVGIVTSGSFSPSFKKNIGLAYVSGTELNLGDSVDIQIRSNQIAAKIVAIPFYKRQSRS